MSEEDTPIIQVRNLCYEVSGHQILRDVTFEVKRGEIFGVMGMSGSGKSTLLKMLMGLLPLRAGEIIIDGLPLAGLSEEELMAPRAKMGMCFQYAALFDSMTAAQNVAFGLRRRMKLPEAEVQEKVKEHLSEVGLYGVGDMMPSELSGGMRKRVGIARELILRPSILLYDEPSSGLDPIMSAVIDELIVELREKLGMTSVVVTHEVEELFGISDRVMMLHDSTVIACDTPAALRATANPVVQQFVHGLSQGPIEV